jgi:hypothetical protein
VVIERTFDLLLDALRNLFDSICDQLPQIIFYISMEFTFGLNNLPLLKYGGKENKATIFSLKKELNINQLPRRKQRGMSL